ncbi:flexible cuticle protein 12-like [Aethina tumida]|uniref:flexible cuticle protein 12-like n=1 Tax=Aethina tumida TaxID=116153 RepID=UPI00096AF901|nr:flexible cuticle protein 12-like [Aethina tumida]
MKVVAVLFAVLAVALAAPQRNPDADAQVLRNDLDNIGVDGYNFAYETSNGIAAQEQAQLVNPNTDNESIAVRGSFRYIGPDGVTYEVTYIADDNGFQPQGAHLPVGPQ